MKGNFFTAVLALSMLHGCAVLTPAKPAVTREILSKLPPELPRRDSHPTSVMVFPPKTRPIYDTRRIAYTLENHQIAYFSQHEWGEIPSQMLLPMIEETLRKTGHFSAVLTPPYVGRYDHALRTEVRELVADFTSEPPLLRLLLQCQLSQGASDRILALKEISIGEPIRARTPEASVAAANDAAAKALLELTAFVLDNAR